MVLIKWWTWSLVNSKRYEALIKVQCLKGANEIAGDRHDRGRSSPLSGGGCTRLTVEIRWNGSKGNGLWALSRDVKRDCTREEGVDQNGVVQWDEEFRHVCRFSNSPWEVTFTILNLTLQLRELKTVQEPPKAMRRSLTMPLSAPLTPCFGISGTLEEGESPSLTRSLRKAKSLKVSPYNEGLLEDTKESNSLGTLKLSPTFQMLKRKLSFKSKKKKEPLMISGIGEDSFAYGSWEHIKVFSRDRLLELQVQVFFATIDQMSDKAAGESACTTLVILLAHWLLSNPDKMPTQSDFDRLIREGALQWRKLCEDESYIAQFPDKHFDLETVLKANVGAISVSSITGFFRPEGVENEGISQHLKGKWSFDSVWDEIKDVGPVICIVGWNDHFFVPKVDIDGYYVIDTLGGRLQGDCNRAYVLKFDKGTTIRRIPAKETVVCRGKETCKEYIESFLATVPIRELQVDMMEGRKRLDSLHDLQLLEIDFHYTQLS